MYPLKFLFTLLADQLLGFGGEADLPGGALVEVIEPSQLPLLMVIYGAGFVGVQVLFVLFYLRAYSLRGALELDAHELSVTREEIQSFLLNASVGLASIAIAVLGGEGAITWAGLVYLLLFPLQTINGRAMGSRRRSKESDARDPVADEGGAVRGEEEGR